MGLTVDVYLTTRTDSLADLRTFRDESSFYKWRSQVKGVAFHTESFTDINDELFREAMKYPIVEVFAVIEYPTGKVLEADEEVGEKLRELCHRHRINFNWNLTRDEQAPADSYKVSMEIVVDKGD